MALSKARLLSIALFASTICGSAVAGTLQHAKEPIYRSEAKVNFLEHGFLGGEAITDQFQSSGVSFSGQMRWISLIRKRRGAQDALLANFNRDTEINAANPFSIKFDYLVKDATFALHAYDALTKFTALLRGREVGYFEATVNANRVEDNAFGFTGLRFDEILIDFGDKGYGTSFDTLNFNYSRDRRGNLIESGVPAVRYRSIFNEPEPEETAGEVLSASVGSTNPASGTASQVGAVNAVPLPAAFWMLLAGLGGLAAARARRSRG